MKIVKHVDCYVYIATILLFCTGCNIYGDNVVKSIWRIKRRPENIAHIDYKQGDRLGRFLNDRGKIKPRRQTGTCARHQRKLARAIKRARHLAMLPFTGGSAR